jgi:hypothetical protein
LHYSHRGELAGRHGAGAALCDFGHPALRRPGGGGAARRWNGQSVSSGELAAVYGFTDLDGSRPDAWRYVVEVQDAGRTVLVLSKIPAQAPPAPAAGRELFRKAIRLGPPWRTQPPHYACSR